MDLGALRALVRDLNFEAHGIDITVSRTGIDETPLATRGIWVTPITDDVPVGNEFQRREPIKVLAISSTIGGVPRGSIVMAPELSGGTIRRWRVDGVERQEVDHGRFVVLPDFELDP